MNSIDSRNHFKVRDASSYDKVTDTFDRYTERFSRPMADCVICNAKLQEADSVLDIGTGTGVLARAAARLVNEGNITGIDLSSGMLTTAEKKAMDEGLKIHFRLMDAEKLEFQSSSFNVVISLYALRHFPDPEQALAEMHRVLEPGGRIVIGVGSAPRLFTLDGIFAGLYRITALCRGLIGRGDYEACSFLDQIVEEYLPKSESEEAEWTEHHAEYSGSVTDMLKRAGFMNIQKSWIGQRSIIDSPDEFWELQATFSSVSRKRLDSADPDQVAELKRDFLERCNAHVRRGGRMVYATGATVLSAVR